MWNSISLAFLWVLLAAPILAHAEEEEKNDTNLYLSEPLPIFEGKYFDFRNAFTNEVRDVPTLLEFIEAVGKDVNDPFFVWGQTYLHVAVDSSKPAAVTEKLLELSGDPNLENALGLTPMGRSFPYGDCDDFNPQEFDALVAAGGKFSLVHKDGNTRLHHFAELHDCMNSDAADSFVARMVQAGIDINAKNAHGSTALNVAATEYESPFIIQALINAGADVNARDALGRTPLHNLILPPLPLTEEEKAEQERTSIPLIYARHRWRAKLDRILCGLALLFNGADPNLRDNAGLKPLDGIEQEGKDLKETGQYYEGSEMYYEKLALYETEVHWMLEQLTWDEGDE